MRGIGHRPRIVDESVRAAGTAQPDEKAQSTFSIRIAVSRTTTMPVFPAFTVVFFFRYHQLGLAIPVWGYNRPLEEPTMGEWHPPTTRIWVSLTA